MEVILLESVRNLGGLGEQVKVKNGFGRNYLIPAGKAVRATKDNIKKFESRRAELEKKEKEVLEKAQARAKNIENIEIEMKVRASEEGKLFGSIGTREIAQVISDKGETVERSEVRLPSGVIRSTGEYEIMIQLHSDVNFSIKLNVVAE